MGYITGVAIVLILGQLGKLLGISSDAEGAIGETLDIIATWAPPTVPRSWWEPCPWRS